MDSVSSGAEFLERDLFGLLPGFVDALFVRGEPRVLSGCVPCQPSSTYTNGRTHPKSQRQLLDEFAEIVEELRPEVVTREDIIVGDEGSARTMSALSRDTLGLSDDWCDTGPIAGAGALGAWACR